jgi:hypothetical protein
MVAALKKQDNSLHEIIALRPTAAKMGQRLHEPTDVYRSGFKAFETANLI